MCETQKISVAVILLIFNCVLSVLCSVSENLLLEKLLNNQAVKFRPTENYNRTTTVLLGLELLKIINVDEKNEIFQVNVWLDYQWKDLDLTWNKSEFGNLTDIPLPIEKIWRPDVLLYNHADSPDTFYASNAVVTYDGKVHWVPPAILTAMCTIDVTSFPFDDQHCSLKFGSWTYHGYHLNLIPDGRGVATKELIAHGEWELVSTSVERRERMYECCDEPYPTITFHLHIRRRARYYMVNIVTPSLLMVVITIIGFSLPPEANQKLTLQMTVLFAIYMFLKMVSELTPATSESVPLLGIFFSCLLILTAASVVFSVFVLNMYFHKAKSHHHMHPMVRQFLLYWLPRALRMQRPRSGSNRTSPRSGSKADILKRIMMVSIEALERDKFLREKKCTKMHLRHKLSHRIEDCLKPFLDTNDDQDLGTHRMVKTLWDIHGHLRKMTAKMIKNERRLKVEKDWRFAARVIDRLCLVLFSFSLFMTVVCVFFAAPKITF